MSMDSYERAQLADALKMEVYHSGEPIVKQDDPGDKFYIIEDGECQAFKTVGEEQRLVLSYKSGDYFGELALLRNEPRAASVMATSRLVKVLALDRRCFKRLLGPLEAILKRQSSRYE